MSRTDNAKKNKHYAFQLKESVPFESIRRELKANEDCWQQLNNSRHLDYKVQREAQAILLRWAAVEDGVSECDVQAAVDYPEAERFPVVLNWLYAFAKKRKATLARVSIARLQPKKRVYSHLDHGTYYAQHDRYHLVINSPLGSDMMCGDNMMRWHEGELWWFDNKIEHGAFNGFQYNRDHLIFDLLPDAR